MFRRLRRSRILREKLLAEVIWTGLLSEHPILRGLGAEELARLRELTTLFLHEKTFENPRGLPLDEYRRAVIAVQACLPVLNLGLDWYRGWHTVVVVPEAFIQEYREYDPAGVAHEWRQDSAGSRDMGIVALSWRDVEDSGWGDNFNVVIHEAAHELDLTDGELNGRPALHPGMNPAEWFEVFSRAFADFQKRVSRRRGRTRLDSYAAEDEVEFFAVACETFFEQPRLLRAEYPDAYRLLALFFRQDPVARSGGPRSRKRT